MPQLPPFVVSHEKQAQQWLEEGRILSLHFSRTTYQILIHSPDQEEGVWCFLQFDAYGELRDHFCDCETEEGDLYLATAYLAIFRGQRQPLHLRFEKSFWLALFSSLAKKHGVHGLSTKEAKHWKTKEGSLSLKSKNKEGHRLFASFLSSNQREQEESSLKFSCLSEKELTLWQAGTPSEELEWELSLWADLAKWCMVQQDMGASFSFSIEEKQGLPLCYTLNHSSFTLTFTLSSQDLEELIPFFSKVNIPLRVIDLSLQAIESISYDVDQFCFFIQRKPLNSPPSGVPCGKWTYVSGDGFYGSPGSHPLSADCVPESLVEQVLYDNRDLLKEKLSTVSIHQESLLCSARCTIDKKGNLRLSPQLSTGEAIACPPSHFFGHWMYWHEKGFFPIHRQWPKGIPVFTPRDQVAPILSQFRNWFNSQPGFRIHLAPVRTSLDYKLTSSSLNFFRRIRTHEGEEVTTQMGPYLYVKGSGFYQSLPSQNLLGIPAGTEIPLKTIPSFLQSHREDLVHVRSFFADQCPIIRCNLQLFVEEGGELHLSPQRDLLPGYKEEEVRDFHSWVYVDGEGFSEVPPRLRLPLKFQKKQTIPSEKISEFLEHQLPSLRPFITSLDRRLQSPRNTTLELKKILRDASIRKGTVILQLNFSSELGEVSVSDLWPWLEGGGRYALTSAGCLDLEEPQFHWLRWLKKEQFHHREGSIELKLFELLRLQALHGIEGEGSKQKQLLKLLDQLTPREAPDITGLKSTLRPYQELGVQWLWSLYQFHLSGLLCDDMGLGKTHQAMALLAAVSNLLRRKRKRSPLRFLVVCPTSVLFHWEEKLGEFLPDLRIRLFYGSQRSLEMGEAPFDLVLTSYGVLKRSFKDLSQFHYDVAIFDEIQIAKNHQTRVHGALRELQARLRIGMTGTPIENQVRELKSLFDAVLPGYMPSEQEYDRLFVQPIEQMGSPERQELLSRLIHPLSLRRRKEEVLEDLPEKIEDVFHCSLLPDQAKLYQEILSQGKKRLEEEWDGQSKSLPYMHIFSLLTALKQICNHPASYFKNPDRYTEHSSGKWELFLELLDEARASGQKVVVFSQYLTMLDIMEVHLKKEGIEFASIRGSTRDRGRQLQRFARDETCQVFLGSLQAVGLGVDLTAASVVIHYDRWWNAAREDQATDRVHRLGQTRGVQVFKLVTKNTLEERIDAIIQKKAELMERIVGVDDHRALKTLSKEDILELLQMTAD